MTQTHKRPRRKGISGMVKAVIGGFLAVFIGAVLAQPIVDNIAGLNNLTSTQTDVADLVPTLFLLGLAIVPVGALVLKALDAT